MDKFVIDTNALVWFFTGDKKLSKKAKDIILKAEALDKVLAIIPTIVMAEITHLGEKRRIPFKIEDILDFLEHSPGILIAPFDDLIFKEMLKLPSNLELHDRIIAASAIFYKAKLVSKDNELTKSIVPTVW